MSTARVRATEDDGASVEVDGVTRRAHTLVAGDASGEVLVLDEPLSLWGGLDPETGRIIDEHHAQFGAVMTGRVVVLPSGRGSSSSSSVLAEVLRLGTGPAAIVLSAPDPILTIGALVAAELYATTCPVVVLED
jgi:predicted aconitase with swiveling domain